MRLQPRIDRPPPPGQRDLDRHVGKIPVVHRRFLPLPAEFGQVPVVSVRRRDLLKNIAVPRGRHGLTVGVDDGQAHAQVVRQAFGLPGGAGNIHPETATDKIGQGHDQRPVLPGHLRDDNGHGLIQRYQFLAIGLGQSLEQGRYFLGQQTGHQPVQGRRRHFRRRRRRHMHGDTVAGIGRIKPVGKRQPEVAGLNGVGEEGHFPAVRRPAQDIGRFQAQAFVAVSPNVFSQPGQGINVLFQSLPEKREKLVFGSQIILAPQTVFQLHGLGDPVLVMPQAARRLIDFPPHQGMTNKQIGGWPGIVRAKRHIRVKTHHQTEQDNLTVGRGLALLPGPAGIDIYHPTKVAGHLPDPLPLHPGHGPGVKPGRFHQLG